MSCSPRRSWSCLPPDTEAELDGWRRRIAAWRAQRPVFVYLNNDWKGYAPANASYLKQHLSTDGEE